MSRPTLFALYLMGVVACDDGKPSAEELRASAAKAEATAAEAEATAKRASEAADLKAQEAVAATRAEWVAYERATWDPNWDKFATSTEPTWVSTDYNFERSKDSVTITRVTYDKGGRLEDAVLGATVKAQYATDRDVTSKNVSVDVVDNVVHLRGAVDSQAEIREAIRLAINTRGVHQVVSHLTVKS